MSKDLHVHVCFHFIQWTALSHSTSFLDPFFVCVMKLFEWLSGLFDSLEKQLKLKDCAYTYVRIYMYTCIYVHIIIRIAIMFIIVFIDATQLQALMLNHWLWDCYTWCKRI